MTFPQHKCGLYLAHNEHRDFYKPLADWIDECDLYTWQSDAAKNTAIATDECWALQWYPLTPIGFFAIAAPTLEELLAFAAKVERGESPLCPSTTTTTPSAPPPSSKPSSTPNAS